MMKPSIISAFAAVSTFSTHSIISIVSIISSVFLVACADEPPAPLREPGIITFGQVKKGGSVEWENGRTRATGSTVESVIPDDIGVFAFGDGLNTTYIFNNQRAVYKGSQEYADNGLEWKYKEYKLDANGNLTTSIIDNLWPYTTVAGSYTPRPWEEMRYRFFAYSPWTETEDVSVTAENYAGFNSFTWDNIPGFTGSDYVLANTLVEVDNRDGQHKTEDAVHFEMRHILSRIRFFFKMDEHYREVRKIELNSLTVLSAGKVKTATFNFNSSLAWDETVHWSNEQTGDAEPVTLFNTAENYFVPTTYPAEPFTSVYVYPQEGFSELKMQVSYTVYDSEGVPTREANVINTINIKPVWNLLSGYYYDIKINIVPDYLYVLSDNDQDFDGWVIIKDSKPRYPRQ